MKETDACADRLFRAFHADEHSPAGRTSLDSHDARTSAARDRRYGTDRETLGTEAEAQE